MPDDPALLGAIADRFLEAFKKIERAIQAQTEAVKAMRAKEHPPQEVHAEIRFPEDVEAKTTKSKKKELRLQLWNLIAAWATLFAVIAYAAISKGQLTQMRKATQSSERAVLMSAAQLELTERPWVDAQVTPDGGLIFDANGTGFLPLKINMRNTGHTPAAATSVNAVFTADPRKEAGLERDNVCAQARREAMSMSYFGLSLFPNVAFPYNLRVTIGKDELQKYSEFSPGKIASPSVIVCIAYRPSFNNTSVYETAYVFDMFKLNPPHKVAGAYFNIGENLDRDHILWQLHPVNAITAN